MTPHNPDNLSPETIGYANGWRLLNEDEITGGKALSSIELWEEYLWAKGASGACRELTYRTRLSPEVLLALRSGFSLPNSPCPRPQRRFASYVFLPTWCLWLIASGIVAPIVMLIYLVFSK